MHVELIRTFRFDAAHSLCAVPEGHKCGSLHGHGYQVDVHIEGEVDPATGWLMDYGELKAVVAPLIDSLDHKNLNDIEGLENSTSELLAAYLWDRIAPHVPLLSALTIWESPNSRCVYRGH
ncbi:MAG: 6-carboxytetrahydropterin synthase QueD [Phycisphaerales bacterium]|jgi:6-pyruvoyltetrahydropterin/6-carboxytetrahydropterin synthase|nr:6-carboxytetrahydropterin synthase QueD [Phycisphaerales bacterium]